MIKMKDAVENINKIMDQAKERISEVEDSIFEIMHPKMSKEKKKEWRNTISTIGY